MAVLDDRVVGYVYYEDFKADGFTDICFLNVLQSAQNKKIGTEKDLEIKDKHILFLTIKKPLNLQRLIVYILHYHSNVSVKKVTDTYY